MKAVSSTDGVVPRSDRVSNEYADEIRTQERFYTDRGIHSVPAVIINERQLISGGQPVEVFEGTLRQTAALA